MTILEIEDREIATINVPYIAKDINLTYDRDNDITSKIHKLFIGCSPETENIKEMIKLSAKSDCPILITGPSGSGKEVTAKTIHAASARQHKPLISINCGAIPHDLIESELFGYTKGSFTGAHKDNIGLFEQADGGTLFLDEIGEMPTSLQVRLLRVLEDGKVRKIGGQDKQVDVRIIAATNQEIATAINTGVFREDLYYRLSVLSIHIPKLSDRCADIRPLVEYFVEKTRDHKQINISTSGWNALSKHSWPGNIRELRNWVARALLLNQQKVINAQYAQRLISMGSPQTKGFNDPMYQGAATVLSHSGNSDEKPVFDLQKHLHHEEKKYMRIALQNSSGIVQQAANTVSMKRTTFLEKMKRYQLNPQYI